jgi:hypothetical protein
MLFNDSVSNKDFKGGICGLFQGTAPEFEELEINHRKPV